MPGSKQTGMTGSIGRNTHSLADAREKRDALLHLDLGLRHQVCALQVVDWEQDAHLRAPARRA